MTESDATDPALEPSLTTAALCWRGRFTPADGLRGSNQARLRNSPCYGAGTVELSGQVVTLRGWQRTWLGIPVEAEVHANRENVRNVVRDDALVHLEIKVGRRWRFVEFAAETPSAATRLAAALPTTQTTGFAESWLADRSFQKRVQGLPGRAWVTPTLVTLNLVAYVVACVLSGGVNLDPYELLRLGANAGLYTTQGEWWRLLTGTFLHIGLPHLAFNMWALWNAGRLTERLFGSGPYLAIYLLAGVLASLASTVWNPILMSVGASGAVFGVLGALLAFVLRGNGLPGAIVRAHRLSTLLFIAFNLVLGALNPSVDNAAHVGGLLTGLMLGWMLARPLDNRHARPVAAQQWAATCAFAAAVLIIGGAYIGATKSAAETPSGWFRNNAWYADKEGGVVRAEVALASQWQAGLISPEQYVQGMRRDVLPFYEDAEKRISRTAPARASNEERDYSTLLLNYVTRRREWLQSVVDNAEDMDAGEAQRTAELSRRTDRAQAVIDLARLREQLNGRPTGLRAALLARWHGFRAADEFTCSLPPDSLHATAIASDAREDGPAQRREIGCEAQRRLLLQDYAFLEQRLGSGLRQLNDLPDGTSSFTGVVDGLDDLFEYGSVAPDQLFVYLSEWRRAYPDSVYPSLLEAMVFSQWAWSSRGGGFAKSVTAQQWQLFRIRIDLALAVLEEIAPRATTHPLWYQLSIHTALDESQPLDEIRQLYQQGVKKNPSYMPLHTAMLRVLLPRWQGSASEVAEFIGRTTISGNNTDYARLFWAYSRYERDNENLFDESPVSWSRIRDGFGRLIREHPASDYWVNAYANLACRERNRAEYQRIRDDLSTRTSSTAWSSSLSLADCDKRFESTTAEPGSSINSQSGGLPRAFDVDAANESVRLQVAAALNVAEPIRAAITNYFEEHGRLPSDEVLRSGSQFVTASPPEATVTLGLGASIDMRLNGGPLDGRKFSWTPTESQGSLKWLCAQETVPEEYLGPPCR